MKRFFKFTIPSIMSMWVYALYTMVDGFFVSNYVGEVEFASVNLSMPIVTSFFALGMLLSIGTQAKVGFNLGRGDNKTANQIFSTAFITLLFVGSVYCLILYLNLDRIIYILGASDKTFDFMKEYLQIIIPFGLFFMTSYQFEVLVKVDGFPIITTIAVFSAALINVILDYVFIVPMGMGLRGAGLATGLAQLVSTSVLMIHFMRRKGRLKFTRSLDFSHLKRLLPLGVGDAINEVAIGYTVFLFNTTLLRQIGRDGLVMYAVVSYISIFVQVTMAGVAQGLAPIFSLDYGRKRYNNIRRTILGGFAFIFGLGLAFKFVGYFFSGAIVEIFLREGSQLKAATVEALSKYSSAYIFIGINVFMVSLFASLGKGKFATTISLLRTPIFITIVMVLYEKFIGGDFIWHVLTISEALTTFFAIGFLIRIILRPLKRAEGKRVKNY